MTRPPDGVEFLEGTQLHPPDGPHPSLGVGRQDVPDTAWVLLRGRRRRRVPGPNEESFHKFPDEPWMGDFPWDPRGAKDDNLILLIKDFVVKPILLFLILYANWYVFFSGRRFENVGIAVILIILLDVGILFVLPRSFYQAARFARHGRGYVRFDQFPFFLGESIDLVFGTTRTIHSFEKVRFILRYIEEHFDDDEMYDFDGPGCYQVYKDSYSIHYEEDDRAGDPEFHVSFPLPEDRYETQLSQQPLRYWELEVRVTAGWWRYRGLFPLPIYEPPIFEDGGHPLPGQDYGDEEDHEGDLVTVMPGRNAFEMLCPHCEVIQLVDPALGMDVQCEECGEMFELSLN